MLRNRELSSTTLCMELQLHAAQHRTRMHSAPQDASSFCSLPKEYSLERIVLAMCMFLVLLLNMLSEVFAIYSLSS